MADLQGSVRHNIRTDVETRGILTLEKSVFKQWIFCLSSTKA